MTNNASYVSGNPANIRMTQNKAYGLVCNATTSTNMGQDCVRVDAEDDIVPSTRSLSNIRTTCNPSYVSGDPANICTTHNEAYRLVHNAVVDGNAEDTPTTVNVTLPSTSSFSDIRMTCNTSYVSGDPANICMTHNEAYRLVHNAAVDGNAEDTPTTVNVTLPSTSSFSDIRMTCNTSYVSGDPTNICMTHNEAYGLVHNAVADSNAEDTPTTVNVTPPSTSSFSDIRMACNTPYVSGDPANICTTHNES